MVQWFPVWVQTFNLTHLPLLTHPHISLTQVNLWLGDGNSISGLHFDDSHNMLCQLSGVKHVVVYPPSDQPFLYYQTREELVTHFSFPGNFTHSPSGALVGNFGAVNALDWQPSQHPLYANSHPKWWEVGPGRCLFIPLGWHHQVFSQARYATINAAINFWFQAL